MLREALFIKNTFVNTVAIRTLSYKSIATYIYITTLINTNVWYIRQPLLDDLIACILYIYMCVCVCMYIGQV